MIAEFIGKADSALGSAKLLLDAGDSDGATNRAWYAMFDAASAALAWAGAAATHDRHKTHSGLIGAFGEHLVRTGDSQRSLGVLSTAFRNCASRGIIWPNLCHSKGRSGRCRRQRLSLLRCDIC